MGRRKKVIDEVLLPPEGTEVPRKKRGNANLIIKLKLDSDIFKIDGEYSDAGIQTVLLGYMPQIMRNIRDAKSVDGFVSMNIMDFDKNIIGSIMVDY